MNIRNLIIIFCLGLLIFYIKRKEPFSNVNRAPKVKFPFRNIQDQNGRNLNIIALGAPFRNDKHKKLFLKYKEMGFPIIGVTSYQGFPGPISNPYEDKYYKQHNDNYLNMCKAWCYCFKDPFLFNGKPSLEISESDFTNPKWYHLNGKKKYDFIYVCLDDKTTHCHKGWQSYNRNWKLAKLLIPIMCKKYNLKGIVVGRTNCGLEKQCNGNLEVKPFQKYWKFIKILKSCRFLFLPNVYDASPRILSEALTCDIPAIVNKNILGGWKYVNDKTGIFFNNEEDFEKSLRVLLNNLDSYKPRDWFSKHYGPVNSGKRLKKFLKEIYPGLIESKIAKFAI
jgi:hypothetical protein